MDDKPFCYANSTLSSILVLLDGHSSHIDLYVTEFCANNGIFLFRLPLILSMHCSLRIGDFSENVSPIFRKKLQSFLSSIQVFLSQKGDFLEFLQRRSSKRAVQTLLKDCLGFLVYGLLSDLKVTSAKKR